MLIVETGEGLKNANSFLGIQEAIDLKDSLGLDIEINENNLKKYSNELSFLNFDGVKLNPDQGLAFPRIINGVNVLVPIEIKKAILYKIHNEIYNKQNNIKEEQVGELRVSYNENKIIGYNVDDILRDFLKNNGFSVSEFYR